MWRRKEAIVFSGLPTPVLPGSGTKGLLSTAQRAPLSRVHFTTEVCILITMNIINEQICSLLEEPDMIAALANVSACINMNYDGLNWAGFYFVKNGELVLGPFQGRTACTHIPFEKGVCGLTYRTKQKQRVDDVLSFKGHIACDSASRSELCVPILVDDACIGEIDLDAPVAAYFTEEEEKEMLQAAADIAAAFQEHHWSII